MTTENQPTNAQAELVSEAAAAGSPDKKDFVCPTLQEMGRVEDITAGDGCFGIGCS